MGRPLRILLRWLNTLVQPARTVSDAHLAFANGLTLCLLLERLRPGARLIRFHRACTRGTALPNIESALALVWSHGPQHRAMPSAEQILDGAPRTLLLLSLIHI